VRVPRPVALLASGVERALNAVLGAQHWKRRLFAPLRRCDPPDDRGTKEIPLAVLHGERRLAA